MIRRAFTMRLKPDSLDEYVRRHDSISSEWSELVVEIKKNGIASITTFQNGLDLFLFSEIEDEQAWDRLWHTEIHEKWAKHMEPLMHMDENGIVEAGELKEIFHFESPSQT